MVEKAEPMHWLSPYRTFLLQPDAQFSMWFTLHEMMLQGKKDKLIQCFRNEAGQDNSLPKMIPPHSTLCPSKGTNVTGDVLQHSGCLDAIRQRCWASIAMQQFNCGKTAASSKGGLVSVHLLSLFNPSQTCANEHKREKRERGEKEGKKGDEKEEEMGGKVLIQRSWPFCQPNTWSSWGLPCISALFLTFSSQFLSFLFPIHQTSLRASPGISLLCNVCLLHDPLSIKKFLLL